MNKQQLITLLDQVGPLAIVNTKLLEVAKDLPEAEGSIVTNAVRKILEACETINGLCAGEVEHPTIPKDAVSW